MQSNFYLILWVQQIDEAEGKLMPPYWGFDFCLARKAYEDIGVSLF